MEHATRDYSRLMTEATASHRHGRWTHAHPHSGPHRHLGLRLLKSEPLGLPSPTPRTSSLESNAHDHGHTHGLVDRSIVRSREGVKAVALSLGTLGLTAAVQLAIYVLSGSVALLADLIHNFGDALTAVPLGIAFFMRSFRAEKIAGLAVVLAIFVSAGVALYETIQRFIHPQDLTHLWVLAAAGLMASPATSSRRRSDCERAAVSRAQRSSQTATMRGRTASSPWVSWRVRSSSLSALHAAIQ